MTAHKLFPTVIRTRPFPKYSSFPVIFRFSLGMPISCVFFMLMFNFTTFRSPWIFTRCLERQTLTMPPFSMRLFFSCRLQKTCFHEALVLTFQICYTNLAFTCVVAKRLPTYQCHGSKLQCLLRKWADQSFGLFGFLQENHVFLLEISGFSSAGNILSCKFCRYY